MNFDCLIPEANWIPESRCGVLQWNHFGVGLSLTHWALPIFIRFDHQDCGHLDGFSIAFFCVAVFYNFYDCQKCGDENNE